MIVRKRPVEVEAFQWDGSAEGATVIINWALSADGTISYACDPIEGESCPGTAEAHYLVIRTLEGDMIARSGYWIIKGVQGEFYGCEPTIFAETYAQSASERSAEERLADLIQDIERIHRAIDADIRECFEDVENWPCDTYKAAQRAKS